MESTLFDENQWLRSIAQKLMNAREEGQLCLQSGDAGYASAPSNIALLKYWGKLSGHRQIPVNSSLSLTLGSFRAFTRVEVNGRFFPLKNGIPQKNGERPAFVLELNGEAHAMPGKMEQFLRNMLSPFAADVSLTVTSKNNFPTACGVASSAAGYAALVAAVADVLNLQRFLSEEELGRWMYEWARLGSGSATRSAVVPSAVSPLTNQFVFWELNTKAPRESSSQILTSTGTCLIHERFQQLCHCVLVLDATEKQTKSSEGHELAQTSLLQNIRLAQFPQRYEQMKAALASGDWKTLMTLAECDAFEMHAVMGTGAVPLRYMNTQTSSAIGHFIEQRNRDGSDMCWTLDAGANPHFIYDCHSSASLAQVFSKLSVMKEFNSARVLMTTTSAPQGVVVGIDALQKFKLMSGRELTQQPLLELNLAAAAERLAK